MQQRPLCARAASVAVTIVAFLLAVAATAQQNPFGAQDQVAGQQGGNNANAVGNVGFGPFGNSQGTGGGSQADFDSLIDLIQSTVSTETWADNGGNAEVRPFAAGGVLVDAAGMLRHANFDYADRPLPIPQAVPAATSAAYVRAETPLRFVSLPRLEREIARRQRARESLDETMLALAGLQRVEYVFLDEDANDLVLAGPAGNWTIDAQGRLVSTATGQPVVRLDDLLTLMRREWGSPGSFFGCSINPRTESLARTQEFIDKSNSASIRPRDTEKWLEQLRSQLGAQDIEIFGIDPASRTAGVLVAADYHMKLIGMGLADGVAGVESYLATVPIRNGKPAVPMTVMRWWFAMHYQPVRTTPEGTAYEIRGQGPCVLSETELLTQRGERVHTGKSEPLTARFAHDFTAHFRLLCQRYPLYGELRNVFDLALVAAIIVAEDLPARVGWQPGLLLDDQRLALPTYSVPREVHTVANHRVVNRRHIVAGVSGGVMIAPQDVLKTPRDVRRYGEIIDRHYGVPDELAATAWWWDAP